MSSENSPLCHLKLLSDLPVLAVPPSDQHLILGAEEGIYTLNLNGSEATMELVSHLSTLTKFSKKAKRLK